jgi:hypothetical protein
MTFSCNVPELCVSETFKYERISFGPEDHLYRVDGCSVYEMELPSVVVSNSIDLYLGDEPYNPAR